LEGAAIKGLLKHFGSEQDFSPCGKL
jgi:hypothetical protein